MDDLDLDAWQTIRREQHDIVTIGQLHRRGFTQHGVDAQVRAGRWQRIHRGVYALHSGPLPPAARRMAAILACRGGALLSHQTAGELWGMVPAGPDAPIHVTVPYGNAAYRVDGLRLHRSRAFAHIGAPGLVPPRTDRVHTLLDLAMAAPTQGEATRLVHEIAVAHRIHGLLLGRAVELRRPLRHRRAITDAITLLLDGIDSMLELRYREDVEVAHDLPVGKRQEPVVVDGHRRYEDVVYDLPTGRVIVRLDGYWSHADKLTALTDRRRSVAALLDHAAALPFGWTEVTTAPCRTAREVEAVLRMVGWSGPSRSCPRCS
ncbi:type IV toxin-antitoxin system AbiEi family antitoxin domain-containing protein [Actinomycetospora lemnae]|uniref:Type IV toxin-antitoxin system AbiEi family antitoxin domain-containing protein n=1 Tax=Actinomycetospora lemnae TaxID=3019891 RepID=A0ABT5SUY1_9PSEU|nr:type IV toxin-antitoxin system AbiEi family antitoxin domain-containing protein [Actinomycetospora sp. DW7H6]MDD7965553.1 type IV toxin-antitoxin system AbiEi family antitoxin domain-containing protein [Actinomycetospora sp. DW7H6]